MAEETYPDDLGYFREHDWARVIGDEAVLGITWFAQDALGEVVYAELPDLGSMVTAGETYAELESVKAVSGVYSPLTGQVVDRNEMLLDQPDLVNSDCYGEGWLVRVRLADAAELSSLMNAHEYRDFLAGG